MHEDTEVVVEGSELAARQRGRCKDIGMIFFGFALYKAQIFYLPPITPPGLQTLCNIQICFCLSSLLSFVFSAFYLNGGAVDNGRKYKKSQFTIRNYIFFFFFKSCLMSIYNLSVMTDPPDSNAYIRGFPTPTVLIAGCT